MRAISNDPDGIHIGRNKSVRQTEVWPGVFKKVRLTFQFDIGTALRSKKTFRTDKNVFET